MDYQVWTKEDEYTGWRKVDCGDLMAARRELEKEVRLGRDPILTQELPYELSITVGEPGTETPKLKVVKKTLEELAREVPKSEAG